MTFIWKPASSLKGENSRTLCLLLCCWEFEDLCASNLCWYCSDRKDNTDSQITVSLAEANLEASLVATIPIAKNENGEWHWIACHRRSVRFLCVQCCCQSECDERRQKNGALAWTTCSRILKVRTWPSVYGEHAWFVVSFPTHFVDYCTYGLFQTPCFV